ncbi:hypothetical protein IM40_02675 [Candidatus Paracaedimonas acanthamoebae]|nr:hypothetical protein IM40_02675 [Candidatus Paracaedimonas acanthamoebae]
MGIEVLNKDAQHVHEWLNEIIDVSGLSNKTQALASLRAVLRELRDNIRIEDLAHFSAQLPIFIRGLLFENWRPVKPPLKERHKEEFLNSIQEILEGMGHGEIEALLAAKGVFSAIEKQVSQEEVDKLLDIVPKGIWEVWKP